MVKVNGQKFTVLKDKKTVITRAGMWKVPHNTREDEVHLKIGRYHKPKEWFESEVAELDKPKSELTLTGDEFVNLISFIQDNYEPFKNGTKAFIPLDNPYVTTAAHWDWKRHALTVPLEAFVKFLLQTDKLFSVMLQFQAF
ncbi:TPA: hypothetical protein AB5C29_003390 [Vibrio cholerae]